MFHARAKSIANGSSRTSRWDKLKEEWLQNGGNKPDNDYKKLWPLSARDLFVTLNIAWKATNDRRFLLAMLALFDHGIIDENGRFAKGWKTAKQLVLKAEINRCLRNMIDDLVESGWSLHRSCAEAAAIIPIRANSFEAAVKKLELFYSRHKDDRREQGRRISYYLSRLDGDVLDAFERSLKDCGHRIDLGVLEEAARDGDISAKAVRIVSLESMHPPQNSNAKCRDFGDSGSRITQDGSGRQWRSAGKERERLTLFLCASGALGEATPHRQLGSSAYSRSTRSRSSAAHVARSYTTTSN